MIFTKSTVFHSKPPAKNILLILIILYIISLISHLNYLPLSFEEPRRGIVALEMMISKNYMVPKINGELYLNKPPLYNWLLIGLFKLTGSQAEWVLRLPTVLSLLIIGWVNYLTVKRYVNYETAIWGSIFFLTSADIYFYFSLYGEIDMFYALIVYLQIISIFIFYKKGNLWLLFLISYFLTAAGLLTKGLPSIAFQGITLLAGAIAVKKIHKLFSLAHLAGLLLFFAMVGGYFRIYSWHADPVPFMVKLFSESAQRTIVEKSFWQSIAHLFEFPFLILRITLPWCLFIVHLWGKAKWRKIFNNDFFAYAIIFLGSNIIIYWLSPAVKNRYLYMFLPFIFNIIAFAVIALPNNRWNRVFLMFFSGITLLASVGVFSLFFVPRMQDNEYIWLITLGFALAFLVVFFLIYRIPTGFFNWIILLVIITRMLFNVVVIPERAESIREKKPIKQEILHIVDNYVQTEKVYLVSAHTPIDLQFKLAGMVNYADTFLQLDWPDFSVSYYLSAANNHILEYTHKKIREAWYLADLAYLPEQSEIEEYHRFFVPNRRVTFVLFKYR